MLGLFLFTVFPFRIYNNSFEMEKIRKNVSILWMYQNNLWIGIDTLVFLYHITKKVKKPQL